MFRKMRPLPFLRVTLILAAAFLLGRTAAQVTSFVTASHSDQIHSSAEGNWGLGFQEEGQPPVGNATVDELAREAGISKGAFYRFYPVLPLSDGDE